MATVMTKDGLFIVIIVSLMPISFMAIICQVFLRHLTWIMVRFWLSRSKNELMQTIMLLFTQFIMIMRLEVPSFIGLLKANTLLESIKMAARNILVKVFHFLTPNRYSCIFFQLRQDMLM